MEHNRVDHKEDLALVLIANAMALPVAFIAKRNWLQNYAYWADLSAWVFVLSVAGSYLLSFLTVSCQSVKSATANPIHSIRNE